MLKPDTTQSGSTKAERGEIREAQTSRVFRQQVIGFAVAGLLVLGISLLRGGWHSVFTPGWWRW